jgi:hypothetical protein
VIHVRVWGTPSHHPLSSLASELARVGRGPRQNAGEVWKNSAVRAEDPG